MRIFLSSMLLFGLITMGNFYCSDSPFDDATNLGSSIIKDKDSLLTVFDGKILNDSVVVKSGHSFIDRTIKDSTDKIISGQHQSTSLAVGSWQNEKAFIYLAFPVDSLNAWAHTLAAGALSPLSLDLLFSSDLVKSDVTNDVTFEVGYYSAQRKSDSLLIDTTRFIILAHYRDTGIDTASHSIPLKKEYLLDTNNADSTIHSGIDTLAFLYIRMDPTSIPSLQFIMNPTLRLRYLTAAQTDTITRSIKPTRADYSVFENNETALNAMAVSSGAAGRYAKLPIDLQPIINAGTDSSTGKMVYSNFPKVLATIQFDSLHYHSSQDSIFFYYALSPHSLNHFSELITIPPMLRSSPKFTRTSLSIAIDLNSYLVGFLKSPAQPSIVYLYCWLPGTNFATIYWKAHDTKIPITYIVSSSL